MKTYMRNEEMKRRTYLTESKNWAVKLKMNGKTFIGRKNSIKIRKEILIRKQNELVNERKILKRGKLNFERKKEIEKEGRQYKTSIKFI